MTMTHPLVELSRTRSVTDCYVEIENYEKHPVLCRFGVWVGWRCNFAETVLLAYEHDPEELYVGWQINGTTVIDPGYSAGTPPWGSPAPSAPSVTYRCPAGGLYHQLSLTSTPSHDQVCLWVQVLYRHPNEANAPFHYGPAMSVCVRGWSVTWPAAKLAETRECLERFYNRLRQYVEIGHVGPGDPVERWLAGLEGDEAVRVKALVETLEQLDPREEPELRERITAELRAIVRWAKSPGASRGAAPPTATEIPTEAPSPER
jgi:hypothetical protein